MKNYTAVLGNGETVFYCDRKRWFWLLSVLYPLEVLLGIWLHVKTDNEAWLLLPLTLIYIASPIIDWLLGEDENNPPEILVLQIDNDFYYRFLTYIVVPLHFIGLISVAYWAGTQELAWWSFAALAAVAGILSGLSINTAHELGHKKSKLERTLAKIVLAIPAYGHFWIEHNHGHHRNEATPEDPARARMGESIYKFALREIPGAFRRSWNIENKRLERNNKRVWSSNNQILQSLSLSVVLQFGLVIAFGLQMVIFFAIHNLLAWWQLTSANYIEHYGLLRLKDKNGKYQRCHPHHSWNSNYIYSNLVLFHLGRHSDHHAHPLRRYQSLRHSDEWPILPTGYFGMYMLAYVPVLWYWVMDKRLLSLSHINGDMDKVNIDPSKEKILYAKYGQSQ